MMKPRHLMTCYQKVTILLLMKKNIQKLMIEFYKQPNSLSAPIMKEVFIKRILKYNRRSCQILVAKNATLVR